MKNMSDDAFRALFFPFGKITSAMIQRDEKGQSKGTECCMVQPSNRCSAHHVVWCDSTEVERRTGN